MLVLCLAAVPMGCGRAGPPRAAIEGQVTIGELPLKSGRIVFIPLAPNEGPAASAAIVDGRYQIDSSEGPIVGQNRVEVESEFELGFSLDDELAFTSGTGQPWPKIAIPPEFNRFSQVTADVKKGETNRFDVAIPAAPHAAARPPY